MTNPIFEPTKSEAFEPTKDAFKPSGFFDEKKEEVEEDSKDEDNIDEE